jgi:Predicted membrane protein
MPDGFDDTIPQTAQRGFRRFPGGGSPGGGFPGGGSPGGGFPGGGSPRGGFPGGGFPRGGFPGGGFPRRSPVRRRLPVPILFPIFYGFPYDRCYYTDRFGRCCDRNGRCCDRWGRCDYNSRYDYFPVADSGDRWYGMPGGWDMMPGMDDYDDG